MGLDFSFTDAIPGSFTEMNAKAYYGCAVEVCRHRRAPIFVEVGVDQGRSLSCVMQAARDEEVDAHLVLVDSWESVLAENKAKVETLLKISPRLTYKILHMKSRYAAAGVMNGVVDMMLIDANHTESYPDEDLSCGCRS
jgi:hypothetical protein